MPQKLMVAVERYLQHCFDVCTAPRVDELARLLKTHPSVLSRTFRAQTGRGLAAIMKRRQIEEAKRLLETTDMDLQNVAVRAGFGTINTLFRLFRVHVGLTPREYRRLCRAQRSQSEIDN